MFLRYRAILRRLLRPLRFAGSPSPFLLNTHLGQLRSSCGGRAAWSLGIALNRSYLHPSDKKIRFRAIGSSRGAPSSSWAFLREARARLEVAFPKAAGQTSCAAWRPYRFFRPKSFHAQRSAASVRSPWRTRSSSSWSRKRRIWGLTPLASFFGRLFLPKRTSEQGRQVKTRHAFWPMGKPDGIDF